MFWDINFILRNGVVNLTWDGVAYEYQCGRRCLYELALDSWWEWASMKVKGMESKQSKSHSELMNLASQHIL